MLKKFVKGRLHFGMATESILGRPIEGTSECVGGCLIQQRSLPRLDSDFLFTDERYLLWEVRRSADSFYFSTKVEAELFAYGLNE